jgi:NAD(P)-dependent dehydrogenase (short-subunit alcohol dehydrogenase family)
VPTALVTGGARRIGRSIVERLAAEGFAVAIHCNWSVEEGETLALTIRESGGRAAVVQGELAEPEAAPRIVEAVNRALGTVDLLVNNASVFEADEATSVTLASWERHLAVNLRSPVFLAREFAAQLPADREGCIVNILDQRVLKPTPQFLSYGLSKAGLLSATQILAQALAPRIRVNAVGPGPTLKSGRQDPADFEKQNAAVLLGHGPEPEEIAEAVLYLARARSVTGQMIAVDGGQHLAWETPDVAGISE